MCTVSANLDLHLKMGDLEAVKMHYRDVINSYRDYDDVQSIEDLIDVLERRDELKYEDKQRLKLFQDKVKQDLPEGSREHCELKLQYTTEAVYTSQCGTPLPTCVSTLVPLNTDLHHAIPFVTSSSSNAAVTPEDSFSLSTSLAEDADPYEESEFQKVLDYVGVHLKRDWRKLGSQLNLKDGELDRIEADYYGYDEKGKQMLKLWVQKKKDSHKLRNLASELAAALSDMDKKQLEDYVLEYKYKASP